MKQEQNQTQSIEKFLLRINKDVKSQAEVAAKLGNRSLNGHIVNLIEQDLRQHSALLDVLAQPKD